jgi:3',5'-cyclic-AMP phosphodiesterase
MNYVKKLKHIIKVSLLFIVSNFYLSGCDSSDFSPWQSNVPSEYTNQTFKNYTKLMSQNEEHFSPFQVALTGDVHIYFDEFKELSKKINEKSDVEFTVVLGDFTDHGLLQEYIWFAEILKYFNAPIFTVIGNHDGLNNGKDIYREMFGSVNYSFVYKEILFVFWNNNRYEWGMPDIEWLEDQLDQNTPTILFAHMPPDSEILLHSFGDRWENIKTNPNLIAAVFAHTHHARFEILDGGLPTYIVESVKNNARYGLLTIEDGEIIFENCQDSCSEAGRSESQWEF